MAKGLLILLICWTVLAGCNHPINQQPSPSSRAAVSDPQDVAPKVEPDEISGTWYWGTMLSPTLPALTQTGTIKRLGDSVVGKVVWLVDDDLSAEIKNGKTDGTNVSFDATFVRQDVERGEVRIKCSYNGTFHKDPRKRIWGALTITGTDKGGTPVKIEHPWNAFLEP